MHRLLTQVKDSLSVFRSPLSLRIVSSIFVSLAVIEGLLLIPSVTKRHQEILAQSEEVSAGKVNWILMTYPNADGAELLAHLQELGRNPMLEVIQGGTVYTPEGDLIGTFGEQPTLEVTATGYTPSQYVNTPAGPRYDAAWVAEQANGETYILMLRHDAAGTRTALVLYTLRIIGTVLLIAACMTLVMTLLLNRQLIRPILTLRRDLAQAGQAIAADQPTPQFASSQYRRRDELGEVITTFRRMYDDIVQAVTARKQAEADLRQQNQQMQAYLRDVDQVTAAAIRVDEGTFEAVQLDTVAAREDELGKLAQMFQLMAAHIQQREQQLQAQLRELTIEIDQTRRQQEVAQITESDYFQALQAELEHYQLEEFWR